MNGAQVGPSLAHPVGPINDGLIPITAGTGLARPFCWFWPGGHTITQEFGEISKLPLPGQLWVSQSSPAQESGQRRSTHREPCTTPSCTHKPRGICHSHDSVISSPPPQNQPASTQTGPGFAFTCFAALVGPSGLDLGKSPSSLWESGGFQARVNTCAVSPCRLGWSYTDRTTGPSPAFLLLCFGQVNAEGSQVNALLCSAQRLWLWGHTHITSNCVPCALHHRPSASVPEEECFFCPPERQFATLCGVGATQTPGHHTPQGQAHNTKQQRREPASLGASLCGWGPLGVRHLALSLTAHPSLPWGQRVGEIPPHGFHVPWIHHTQPSSPGSRHTHCLWESTAPAVVLRGRGLLRGPLRCTRYCANQHKSNQHCSCRCSLAAWCGSLYHSHSLCYCNQTRITSTDLGLACTWTAGGT